MDGEHAVLHEHIDVGQRRVDARGIVDRLDRDGKIGHRVRGEILVQLARRAESDQSSRGGSTGESVLVQCIEDLAPERLSRAPLRLAHVDDEALQRLHQILLPSQAPIATAQKPSRLEARRYVTAPAAWPNSRSRSISYSYVENVVYAPTKPTGKR